MQHQNLTASCPTVEYRGRSLASCWPLRTCDRPGRNPIDEQGARCIQTAQKPPLRLVLRVAATRSVDADVDTVAAVGGDKNFTNGNALSQISEEGAGAVDLSPDLSQLTFTGTFHLGQ
jgi:hypothetical protein